MLNSFGLDSHPLQKCVWLAILILIASLYFGNYYSVLIVYSIFAVITSLVLLWTYFTESNDIQADIVAFFQDL